jgi:subtilisin family serine protease
VQPAARRAAEVGVEAAPVDAHLRRSVARRELDLDARLGRAQLGLGRPHGQSGEPRDQTGDLEAHPASARAVCQDSRVHGVGERVWGGMGAAALALGTALAMAAPPAAEEGADDVLAEIETLEPSDPLFSATGSWGQAYEDQWALRRIGFLEIGAGRSAWDAQPGRGAPVAVAVIDSGIDWSNPELPPRHLWSNPREQPNGIDDDANGYVDDRFGWNFNTGDALPWDDSGHGTWLAGIIAASHDGAGMAGVNPGARIMALEVLDAEGRGSGAALAAALDYAAANHARVILLGFPGEGAAEPERAALGRALAAGALVVAPAGDASRELARDALAAFPGVIAVGAVDRADARARFSGWGPGLDLVAPGVDVLGLRARGTDWLARSGAPAYRARAAQVGRQHYRASSSAGAAALVAGTASLLIAQHPKLDAAHLARVLCQSAHDLGVPGYDVRTGCGRLDARAALTADPDVFLEARIDAVEPVAGGPPRLRVIGSADADVFQNARLLVAPAGDPERWIELGGALNSPVRNGALAELDASALDGSPHWLLRLIVRHANGQAREARFDLDLGW